MTRRKIQKIQLQLFQEITLAFIAYYLQSYARCSSQSVENYHLANRFRLFGSDVRMRGLQPTNCAMCTLHGLFDVPTTHPFSSLLINISNELKLFVAFSRSVINNSNPLHSTTFTLPVSEISSLSFAKLQTPKITKHSQAQDKKMFGDFSWDIPEMEKLRKSACSLEKNQFLSSPPFEKIENKNYCGRKEKQKLSRHMHNKTLHNTRITYLNGTR